jgi:ribonuclease D
VNTTLTYITTQPQLDECLAILHQSKVLAFDLEFDRDRYTYGFDLCLVQIATPQACFVIDPLADIELEAMFRMFENKAIKKLVHCPGEDLRLLHSLKCYPTNLVDTEVYAKLLNYEQTSLSNMLTATSGIALNKKLQTSNWGKRPLTDAQLEYAAADVLYLFDLEEKLRKEAIEKNVIDMVEQEFAVLNEIVYTLEPKENFIKKNDRQFMSPYDQYLLNELFKYRDTLARFKNKPAHQIIPETVLRLIAYKKIVVNDLPTQSGIHPMLRSAKELSLLAKRWDEIHAEANAANLSKRREGQAFSDEERQAFEHNKQQLENARLQVFQPIQQWIAGKYGELTMRFILSTTLVNDILRGEAKLTAIKPAYRFALIQEAATSLSIDISPWI